MNFWITSVIYLFTIPKIKVICCIFFTSIHHLPLPLPFPPGVLDHHLFGPFQAINVIAARYIIRHFPPLPPFLVHLHNCFNFDRKFIILGLLLQNIADSIHLLSPFVIILVCHQIHLHIIALGSLDVNPSSNSSYFVSCFLTQEILNLNVLEH